MNPLARKAEKLARAYVLKRDKGLCQKCKRPGHHCSHVFSKGAHPNPFIRFEKQNLKLLCWECHEWWHKNPEQAMLWFETAFPGRALYLQKLILDCKGMGTITQEQMEGIINDLK